MGRGEADDVQVIAVEERDEPRNEDEPQDEPAKPLLLDDLGDVDDLDGGLPSVPSDAQARFSKTVVRRMSRR
jgi:hypothetical protein